MRMERVRLADLGSLDVPFARAPIAHRGGFPKPPASDAASERNRQRIVAW